MTIRNPLDANKPLREIVHEFANARCDLNTYAQIVLMCEGGSMIASSPASRQIIGICQREIQRELRKMDKAAEKILKKFAPQ